MKKKLGAIFLAATMVMCFMPSMAFATVGANDVAKIGDTGYATLQAAVTDANGAANGATITLLKDVTMSQTMAIDDDVVISIPSGSNITLDMAGKTINFGSSSTTLTTVSRKLFDIQGTLTVTGNGTINSLDLGAATYVKDTSFAASIFIVGTSGSLNIVNGTYNTDSFAALVTEGTTTVTTADFSTVCTTKDYDSKVVIEVGNGTFTMKGGSVTATAGSNANTFCGMYAMYSYTGGAVTLGDSATMTGPTMTSYMATLGANNTTDPTKYIIYGGKYTSNFSDTKNYRYFGAAVYASSRGTIDIYGGEFIGQTAISFPYSDANVNCNIYGGTFKGNDSSFFVGSKAVNRTGAAANSINIYGGVFSSDPENIGVLSYANSVWTEAAQKVDYVPSGYDVYNNTSAQTWSVSHHYVASPTTPTTTTTTTTTPTTGGSTTETPVATVTTTTQPTVTVTDNTAKVTVPAEDTAKIVEQTAAAEKAAADAGTKVESNIVISAGTSTAAKTEVVLPAATVNDIATKTDASLTVETPAGDAKIDPEVLDKAAETAGTSGNVTLVIEKIALETLPAEAQEALGKDAIVVKVELITDNGNITTFPEGSGITLSLTLDPSTDVSTKRFVYVTSTGVITEIPYKVINGKAVAKLPHLSYYAFMDKAQADAAIAAQNAKIKAGVQATKVISLKAVPTKGKVKLTWSKTAGYKMDGYQIYKSSKSAGGYKLMKTAAGKYYINTMGLKAGNTYYYKVRGFRTIDGVKVYTSFAKIKVVAK